MIDPKSYPRNIELEEKILGTIITDNLIEKAMFFLNRNCFYLSHHQELWDEMEKLHEEKRKLNILTIETRLRKAVWFTEVGGIDWLMGIFQSYILTIDFEEHCKVLYEIYIRRELMTIAAEMYSTAETGDPFDLRDNAEQKIKDMVIVHDRSKTAGDVRQDVIKRFDDILHKRLVSIPTPFPTWNKYSGGLNKGDFIVMGSYSSNGKTSLAINLVYHAACLGYKTKIYSFEMSDVELYKKQMALVCGYTGREIEHNQLFSKREVVEAIDHIGSLPVVYDCKHSHIKSFERDIRHEVKRNGVKLVVVDYIQLMHTTKQNRAESIGSIAIALKGIALELQIPIIGISQLKRPQGAGRSAPPPSMDMLKESGELENAADIIVLPWIPIEGPTEAGEIDYNGETIKTLNPDGTKLMTIKFAKGRNYGVTKMLASINGYQKIIEKEKELPMPDSWMNKHEADSEETPF